MSKIKLQAAREYIQAKDYGNARNILKSVDHPIAREWEAKIDKLSPPKKPNKSNRVTVLFLAIILLAIIAYVGLSYLNQSTSWATESLDMYLTQNSPP